MRFVPVKTETRQAVLMSHRTRDFLVRQKTQRAYAIRAHPGEFGLVDAKGVHNLGRLIAGADETARRPQTMLGIGPITASVLAVIRDDRGWGSGDPLAVVFTYAPGRRAMGILTGFEGILRVDLTLAPTTWRHQGV